MADHGHGGRSRRGGPRGLAAALRAEARAERPTFSASLHGRVVAAVAVESRAAGAGRGRSARVPALIGVLAAAVACVVGVAWFRPAPRAGFTAGVDATPGIERLPTLDEIGEGVVAEVTTLAAAAVGVAEWADLATFDPAAFAAADDAGR